MKQAKKYTAKEDAIIVENLPKVGYVGLLEMLPGRTHHGLVDRVKTLRAKGVEIGPAFIGRIVQSENDAAPDEKVIRENLMKVGYPGLMQLLPHRGYYWLRNRVKKMRAEGRMPKAERTGRPRGGVSKGKDEESTVEKPRRAGWRHTAYMRGEVEQCSI